MIGYERAGALMRPVRRSVTAVAVLAIGGVAAPPVAAPPVAAATDGGDTAVARAETPAGERSSVVTLVTGDRVRLGDQGEGPRSVGLLPGSPSYGTRPLVFGSAESTYVIPRLSPRARDRLGYSMFDVTALARAQRDGRIPVEVRFEPGTPAHDLPGIDVDAAAARRTSAGSFVADASYAADAVHADPADWSGVSSVRLAAASGQTAASGDARRKHRLTIRVKNRAGDPIKGADAWVQNLDDGRLFNKPVKVEDGRAAVSVPKGNYSVLAYHGRYLAGNPELAVTDATTVRLDLSDASVGYDVSVDGARPSGGDVFGDMLIARRSEKHGLFRIVGDSTARLQPMPGPFSHGTLGTQVGGYFVRGERKGAPNVFTLDVAKGIPAELTFQHDRSDFARIPIRVHSDGAQRQGRGFGTLIRDEVAGRGRGMSENTGWARAVDTPARYTLWLQAGERVKWNRYLYLFDDDSDSIGVQLGGSYESGAVDAVHVLRAPVGPGLERGIDDDRTGQRCLLCRDGNRLRGRLPLLSGAGTGQAMDATEHMGSWQLRGEREVLQRGHRSIRPKLEVPAKKRDYTLRATSRLDKLGWRLSNRVTTSWGFASRRGTGVVPLLMPSYVPPVTLKGRAEPGPMSYRLDLENLGPVESRITKASLRYSTNDGKSWHPARLHRLDDNSFRVEYRNPRASDGHRYVSLRVRALDAGGRTVEETALRAYRLGG